MPSDPRIPLALDALAEPIAEFRSMLASTSEQIRLLISTRVERNGSSREVARAEFGDFAAGRIDPDRMAKLLARVEPPELEHADVVSRTLDVCTELLDRRENLFLVIVREGDDLRDAVGRALAEIGRAFAATRIVELITKGEYDAAEHAGLLEGHPFDNWSRAEREVSLALIVRVSGQDLRVGGLANFLDRSFKLVLIVDGESPPAPLVKLITPRVLVEQSTDPQELDWIARYNGPGVVALMPDEAAHFRHDPAGGPTLADRIVITQLPPRNPRRLRHSSAFQQKQDLAQLEALAATPAAVVVDRDAADSGKTAEQGQTGDAPAPATADPVVDQAAVSSPAEIASPEPIAAPAASSGDAVDKLSAWLLEQADLPGPG
jgi:hypothetical protein